jgi:hypothetical protein
LFSAADALGDPFNEGLQLVLTWRCDSPKHRRRSANEVCAQHVKVN